MENGLPRRFARLAITDFGGTPTSRIALGGLFYNETRTHFQGVSFTMNTGAPMEVLKRLFFILIFLCTAVIIVSTAEARPQNKRTSGPEDLVNDDPCVAVLTVDHDNAPDQLVCVGSGKLGGVLASINIPVPMIVDKQPELSLVGIPTYFSMTWDASSFGYTDSDSTTYEWIGDDNRRNRLTGVRIQLRIVPYRVNEEFGNVQVTSLNSNLFLKADNSDEESTFSDEVCNPGWKGDLNSLLAIPEEWGGWAGESDEKNYEPIIDCSVCDDLKDDLVANPFNNVPGYSTETDGSEIINPDKIAGRYPSWKSSSLEGYPRIFGAISESASISGEGMVNGSPAYQIDVKTYVQVKTRAIWNAHEIYERVVEGLICDWVYLYSGYDTIDLDQWPDPIYCRKVYGWNWVTQCTGEDCYSNFSLGNPEGWWKDYRNQKVGLIDFTGNTVYFTDGYGYRYSNAIEMVVIQAQPLLIVP